MRHRGPDAEGFYTSDDDRVMLAHCRLAILGLTELGNQPMVSACGRLTITFNGEIYNYQELAAGLANKGHTFYTGTDTEVVLALYSELGPASFALLRGMFAIAIWDQEKRELVLARDSFGIKPLYYASTPSAFLFSSQVRPLLTHPGVDSSPDPIGHAGYFTFGHVPSGHTLYRGISGLQPGSWIKVTGRGMEQPVAFDDISCYFQPDATGSSFGESLLDSVEHHFLSDVPVSVFLSAGKDSSTLLALSAEVRERIHATTLAFKEFEGTHDDETPLAALTAKHYGAEHTVQVVEPSDFADDLEHIILSMDKPTIDGVNTYYVCKTASRGGVKVALSGLGADELLGGYPSFAQIPKLV